MDAVDLANLLDVYHNGKLTYEEDSDEAQVLIEMGLIENTGVDDSGCDILECTARGEKIAQAAMGAALMRLSL